MLSGPLDRCSHLCGSFCSERLSQAGWKSHRIPSGLRRAAGRAWLEGAARGSRAPAPGGAGGFLGAEPPSPGAQVPAAPAPRPRVSARQAAAFPGLFPRLSPSRPARGLQLLPCPGAAPIPGAPSAAPFPRSPLPAARSFLPPLPPVRGGLPRPRGPPLPAIARFPSAPVTHGPRPRSARPRWVLFPTPPRPFPRLPPAPVLSPARCQPPRWPAVPSLGRVHFIPTLIPRIPHFLLSNSRGNKNPPFSSQTPARPRPPRPPPRCHPGSLSRRPLRAPQKVLEREEDSKPLPAAPPDQPPLSPRSGSEFASPCGTLEFLAGTITSNEWSSPTSPEGSNDSGGSEALDKPIDNDAEGVWSPDIEQSFQEALAIYPPCGRRKIILSDEGKMYGRNELIARYIKLRTGKTRTRKQVSSHIQVLARRKAREIQAKLKDQAAKDKAMQSMATMSSAQIISATAFHSKMALPGLPRPAYPAVSGFWQGALPGQAGSSQDVKPFSQQPYAIQPPLPLPGFESPTGLSPSPSAPAWQGRRVASSKLWMLEFSAFLEQQQDQDTDRIAYSGIASSVPCASGLPFHGHGCSHTRAQGVIKQWYSPRRAILAVPSSLGGQTQNQMMYNKHLFVHIGQSSPSYSDPYLEAVDIRQIYDKFPEKKGGLKELFERGPANAFFLVKFWADLNTNIEDESRSFYGVSSQYESPENMVITCSTKVCSFGKQVVEKVETEYARYENGHYSYRIHRSPLCEYMINFIHKLKHLPEKYMMNSVLENFTILQVVTNRDTQETLLCIAYVFEVSTSDHGAQHHIYRLVKD